MHNFKSMMVKTIAAVAVLGAVSGAAFASSVTERGETVGLALGAPLPEGIYLVNTASYIERPLGAGKTVDALVNIPVLAWSSPWKVLGGRFEAYGALPEAAVAIRGTNGDLWRRGWYNPAGLAGIAWDLGNGFYFSNFIGGYAPIRTELSGILGNNVWTFNERAALTYLANGNHVTIHAIYGSNSSDVNTHKDVQPDYLNVDVTALHSLGKWDVGLAAYGSADLSSPTSGYKKNSQFALGPIVGYNFTGITVQTYLTQDVSHKNYGRDGDTTAWLRVVVPLY